MPEFDFDVALAALMARALPEVKQLTEAALQAELAFKGRQVQQPQERSWP